MLPLVAGLQHVVVLLGDVAQRLEVLFELLVKDYEPFGLLLRLIKLLLDFFQLFEGLVLSSDGLNELLLIILLPSFPCEVRVPRDPLLALDQCRTGFAFCNLTA